MKPCLNRSDWSAAPVRSPCPGFLLILIILTIVACSSTFDCVWCDSVSTITLKQELNPNYTIQQTTTTTTTSQHLDHHNNTIPDSSLHKLHSDTGRQTVPLSPDNRAIVKFALSLLTLPNTEASHGHAGLVTEDCCQPYTGHTIVFACAASRRYPTPE